MLRQHRYKIFTGGNTHGRRRRKWKCAEEVVQGHAVQQGQTGLEVAPEQTVPIECFPGAEMDLYTPPRWVTYYELPQKGFLLVSHFPEAKTGLGDAAKPGSLLPTLCGWAACPSFHWGLKGAFQNL